MPIQRVPGKLAPVPHIFQLRLFVRPTSLALHVNVDVHGFRFRPGETEKRQKVDSDSESVSVASGQKISRAARKAAG